MIRVYLIACLVVYSSTSFGQHSKIDFISYLVYYIQGSKHLYFKDSTHLYLVEVEPAKKRSERCLKFFYVQDSILKIYRDTVSFTIAQTSEIEKTFIQKGGVKGLLLVLLQKVENIANPATEKVFNSKTIESLLDLVNRVSFYRKKQHFFLNPIIVFEEEPLY